MKSKKRGIRSFFQFDERHATYKKEILGGLSTFLAMVYIVAVNPSLLSMANGGDKYQAALFIGTVVTTFITTFAMGLFANVPIATAPGMGINSFIAFTVAGKVLGLQLPEALVCVMMSGILYSIIVITPARRVLQNALPKNIKLAIGAMIGFFIAYIGLNDSGIIVNATGSVTRTQFGDIKNPLVIIAIITLLLAFILHFLNVTGGIIIAIIAAVIMLAITNAVGGLPSEYANPFKTNSYDDFSQFGDLSKSMWNAFGSTLSNGKAYIAIIVMLYISFFDTTGSLITMGQQMNLDPNGKWLPKANAVDAAGCIVGSMLCTSPMSAYIESSVGISVGARTGFAAIITSLLIGLTILLYPIMGPILPVMNTTTFQSFMPATGPVLVLVGSLMAMQLRHFDWKETLDIPVLFVTIIFGMLTYSISAGIAAGMVIYGILNASGYFVTLVTHKRKKVQKEEIRHDAQDKVDANPDLVDFKTRLSIPIIVMICLGIAYFATLPLYT